VAAIWLFVYGSLLRGGRHHEELAGATFVREARTSAGFAIYDIGDYPALVRTDEGVVSGELYEVSERLLAALDAFEGDGYERGLVTLEDGASVAAYLLAGPLPAGATRIPTGSWQAGRPDRR
jgi:gamma-glutamylcyclotransferase (GGCT)/AIG2-like uncharacterized protein YtfP